MISIFKYDLSENKLRKLIIEILSFSHKEEQLKSAKAFLLFMLSLVKPKTSPDHLNSVFYLKGNKVLFEYDKKNGYFFVDYDKIWSVLEGKYGLNNHKVRYLIKGAVEQYLKLKGVTPFSSNCALSTMVEQYLKLKGVTPQIT